MKFISIGCSFDVDSSFVLRRLSPRLGWGEARRRSEDATI